MKYVVPATADTITRLVPLPPLSSSRAMRLAMPTPPAYAAKYVSKLLPLVSSITAAVADAVHRHHTEYGPPTDGSPISLVAPTFVPTAVPDVPDNITALEMLSFIGD